MSMSMSRRGRTLHRWLAAVFTLFVLANFAVMPLGDEALGMVVGALTLIPLVLLMVTGWYLWMLPYLRRGRAPTAD